jgi:hypothetical protein
VNKAAGPDVRARSRPAGGSEEHDVDGEAHAEGVDGVAARDQQPVARRELFEEGQPEQARPESARLQNREAAADGVPR